MWVRSAHIALPEAEYASKVVYGSIYRRFKSEIDAARRRDMPRGRENLRKMTFAPTAEIVSKIYTWYNGIIKTCLFSIRININETLNYLSLILIKL